MAIRTNILKANFDMKRKLEHPGVDSIALQSLNDISRTYETYRTVYSGWIIENVLVNYQTGERQLTLKITDNAVTDGLTTIITSDEVMTNLAAIVVAGVRYECRNPQPPTKQPAYFAVNIEMLGAV